MAKTKNKDAAVAEFLFWLHSLIVFAVLISGLFVSLPWVVLIVILMRLQQFILHGCFITLLEVKTGGLPKHMVYFQLAAKRFFGIRLSRYRGVHIVSNTHIFLTFLISLLATFAHFRIQL